MCTVGAHWFWVSCYGPPSPCVIEVSAMPTSLAENQAHFSVGVGLHLFFDSVFFFMDIISWFCQKTVEYASAVIQALYQTVDERASKPSNLTDPTFTYCHENWVISKRVRS